MPAGDLLQTISVSASKSGISLLHGCNKSVRMRSQVDDEGKRVAQILVDAGED
jgi:hypothetical protein